MCIDWGDDSVGYGYACVSMRLWVWTPSIHREPYVAVLGCNPSSEKQ